MAVNEQILDQVIEEFRQIHFLICGARNLVDDGKEVLCSNKLQGILVRNNKLLKLLVQLKETAKNDVVAEDSNKT